jgi:hypothetical protein
MGVVNDKIDEFARITLEALRTESFNVHSQRYYDDKFKKLNESEQLEVLKYIFASQNQSILEALVNDEEIRLPSLGTICKNKIRIELEKKAKELIAQGVDKDERQKQLEILARELKIKNKGK